MRARHSGESESNTRATTRSYKYKHNIYIYKLSGISNVKYEINTVNVNKQLFDVVCKIDPLEDKNPIFDMKHPETQSGWWRQLTNEQYESVGSINDSFQVKVEHIQTLSEHTIQHF